MKFFNKTIGLKAALTFYCALALASVSLTATSALAQTKNETRTVTSNSSVWKWEWNDDGWKKLLEIRGKAEFNDDYTDIRDVSEGGSVTIEEVRGGTARRLVITRNANGELQRTFSLNGQARSVDEDARQWVARIVIEAVRQSAIDADKRIQRIFERRGLSGVLEEISLSHGDYAKRLYFEALFKNRNLNASALQTALREAGRQISSDYDQAQLLIAASELVAGKAEVLPAFFEVVGSIKSDYDRRRTLSVMLKRNGQSRDVLVGVVKAAANFSSDYEKSQVLKEAATFNLEDAAVATAFFQTVRTISSDYEHRGVLSAVLKRREQGPLVLSRMLESVARMSSDYEKATFLVEASSAYANDARLRSAFLQTADTIKSEYERGKVLSAMRNK